MVVTTPPTRNASDGKWYYYNDSRVTEADVEDPSMKLRTYYFIRKEVQIQIVSTAN